MGSGLIAYNAGNGRWKTGCVVLTVQGLRGRQLICQSPYKPAQNTYIFYICGLNIIRTAQMKKEALIYFYNT